MKKEAVPEYQGLLYMDLYSGLTQWARCGAGGRVSCLVPRLLLETWTVPSLSQGQQGGLPGLEPHASVLLSNSINKCVLSTNYVSGSGLGVAGRGCKGE